MIYWISLPQANLWQVFQTSNWLSGKLIVLILLTASVFAWTVMIAKYRELQAAQISSRRFLHAFRREKHPLTLFLRKQRFDDSPLFRVYEAGCAALSAEVLGLSNSEAADLLSPAERLGRIQLTPLQIEVVRRVTERTVADQALLLEDRMGFLMTAVSASPLLGLLGTVWGVMDAFSAMAVKGMANLSAVAPGISSALLTTVVGLLVAIPSSIGYNMLAGRIRQLAVQMDNFSQEFVADLQRSFTTS